MTIRIYTGEDTKAQEDSPEDQVLADKSKKEKKKLTNRFGKVKTS